jgi:hypothetical protein
MTNCTVQTLFLFDFCFSVIGSAGVRRMQEGREAAAGRSEAKDSSPAHHSSTPTHPSNLRIKFFLNAIF